LDDLVLVVYVVCGHAASETELFLEGRDGEGLEPRAGDDLAGSRDDLRPAEIAQRRFRCGAFAHLGADLRLGWVAVPRAEAVGPRFPMLGGQRDQLGAPL